MFAIGAVLTPNLTFNMEIIITPDGDVVNSFQDPKAAEVSEP